MGYTLSFQCTFDHQKQLLDWWSTIYNLLIAHEFAFVHPDSPPGVGACFYYRYLSPDDDDGWIEGSWQDARKEALSGRGSALTTFWWYNKHTEEWCDLVFGSHFSKDALQLDFYTIGASIPETYHGAKDTILYLLHFFKNVCEIIIPESGQVYWEDLAFDYAPWAVLGAQETAEQRLKQETSSLSRSDQIVMQHSLTNGQTLYVLDPVPFLGKKCWDFVSLQ